MTETQNDQWATVELMGHAQTADGADLRRADLRRADLYGTDLRQQARRQHIRSPRLLRARIRRLAVPYLDARQRSRSGCYDKHGRPYAAKEAYGC